jgi:hypothetical protein
MTAIALSQLYIVSVLGQVNIDRFSVKLKSNLKVMKCSALAQIAVFDDWQSKALRAILALLKLLDVSRSVITIDAMGTQHEIVHRIVNLGADYILALKANYPTLYPQVQQWF